MHEGGRPAVLLERYPFLSYQRVQMLPCFLFRMSSVPVTIENANDLNRYPDPRQLSTSYLIVVEKLTITTFEDETNNRIHILFIVTYVKCNGPCDRSAK